MARNNRPYTYADAGFNGFLRRSISSNPDIGSLRSMARSSNMPNAINFDNMQVSGNLGDVIEVGKILINGSAGRIEISDDSDETIGIIGDLGDV